MIRRLAAPAPLRPRAVLLIGAVLGSITLGGCGAGQVAQTANQVDSYGAAATSNGIAVRNAEVVFPASPQGAAVYPVGGSAPLEMYVINQGTRDDKLVSASSPVAASVQISGQSDLPAGLAMIVGGETDTRGQVGAGASSEPSAGASAAPSGSARPSATRAGAAQSSSAPSGSAQPSAQPGAGASTAAQEPSDDAAPTGSSSASGEAPAAGLQPAPAINSVDPGTRHAQVVLTGLREDIKAGLIYEVDLTFERAGQVRVMMPVGYPAQPRDQAAQGG